MRLCVLFSVGWYLYLSLDLTPRLYIMSVPAGLYYHILTPWANLTLPFDITGRWGCMLFNSSDTNGCCAEVKRYSILLSTWSLISVDLCLWNTMPYALIPIVLSFFRNSRFPFWWLVLLIPSHPRHHRQLYALRCWQGELNRPTYKWIKSREIN